MKILHAIWDKNPKTKFLTVFGLATGHDLEQDVVVELNESPSLNEKILLLKAHLTEPQPERPPFAIAIPFVFNMATEGDEPWESVTIVYTDLAGEVREVSAELTIKE